MPVKPNVLERLAFYRFNRAPAPILDLFAAAGFRATCLAIDAGVFDALAAGHERPEAVAEAVDAHPDGVRSLLSFLEPLDYVQTTETGYTTTAMTETWLLGDDPNVAPWLTYWNDQVFDFWDEHLETALREGAPTENMYDWLGEHGGWEQTQRGFRSAATLIADDALDAIDLPDGDATLLDVGGGHGYYSIEACRRQPDLSATIVDDPAALDLARSEVENAGLDDRITCRGADALTDDLGGDYDLAFCFNVVHGYDPATNRRLFERVGDALAPGGQIAVLDQFEGETRFSTARIALAFASYVFATTLGATVYEADVIADWVRQAGFVEVETTRFRTLPGMGVVTGTKG